MIGRVLSLFAFIFLFDGCVEQIELSSRGQGDQIVIFGGINSANFDQKIEIYRTSPIQNRIFPLVGATVKVIDNFGGERTMFGDAQGVYRFGQGSPILIPGREYFLDVVLFTGEHYQSTPQALPAVLAFENVDREFKIQQTVSESGVVVDNEVMEITGLTGVNNPTNEDFYFRWAVQETYVLRPTDFPDIFSSVPAPFYFTQFVEPQRITLFDGEGIRVDSIGEKVLAIREVDYTFLDRHIFTTVAHSITKESFEFWRQLDLLTNSTGSIFDVPPAPIRSNLFNVNDPNEIVLGFFEVANSTISRFATAIDSGPFPIPPSGCLYDSDLEIEEYPSYCLQCLPEDGCTTVRPPFFDG